MVRRSDCGTGWVFNRDMRHRINTLYGLYPENLELMASSLRCNHLLIKASRSRHYESDEEVQKTLEIYKKNPKFVYRVLEGDHHLHISNADAVSPVINHFIKSKSSL